MLSQENLDPNLVSATTDQQKALAGADFVINCIQVGGLESWDLDIEIPRIQNLTYLTYPVLHELWMGLKNKQETRALMQWRERFIQLKRLVVPTVATLTLIGDTCLQLRISGKLDPVYPKHYNDISIAALAQQIGATVLTKNQKDFMAIRDKIDFEFESVG